MKIYALLATRGHAPGLTYEIYAVTHATSLEKACRKFRVRPMTEDDYGYYREAIAHELPLPPEVKDPEFVQVNATHKSASELGHSISIPYLFGFMRNMGAWVCELPTID